MSANPPANPPHPALHNVAGSGPRPRLQALQLEVLDVGDPVSDASFQAEIGGTFAAVAPALERALRYAEPPGELRLGQMADLGRLRSAIKGPFGFATRHAVFSAVRRAALSAAE